MRPFIIVAMLVGFSSTSTAKEKLWEYYQVKPNVFSPLISKRDAAYLLIKRQDVQVIRCHEIELSPNLTIRKKK